MTTSVNRPYIPEVDQLRAFAALLVVFYHGLRLIGPQLANIVPPENYWIIPRNPALAAIEEGHSGVGLFIVLSGFILSLGAVGRRIDYGRFMLARILRLYPLLLVFTIVAYSIHPVDFASLLSIVLPVNATSAMYGNFMAMFWAVAVEFQCYLIFPFLILFSNSRGTRFLLQVIAVAIVLRVLAVFSEGANARDISYWTVVGRIDQFCLGMIAARLYLLHGWRDRTRAIWFPAAAAAALLTLWAFNRAGGWPVSSHWKLLWPPVEGCVWALFILCYLSAGRVLPGALSSPATWVGERSYSLYLIHFVVLKLVIANQIYVRATGVIAYDAVLTTAVVAVPLALLISMLLYETIEKPFLQLRPKYVISATGIGSPWNTPGDRFGLPHETRRAMDDDRPGRLRKDEGGGRHPL